jgi:uncharacterized MAPEG superfamily protein
MSVLLWVLLALVLLPYFARIPTIRGQIALGGYDYHNPRAQQARLAGLAQRANAAHQNSFEALQLYLAAVAACGFSGLIDGWMQLMALGFLLCRIAFILLYWLDRAYLRSTVWVIGTLLILTMIIRAALSLTSALPV